MPLEGLRKLPPCPNLNDITLHPVFDDTDLYSSLKRFEELPSGGWRERPVWVLWEATPTAYPVTHVGAWGEMVTEADPAELESMSDAVADMEMQTALQFKTADNQDILECNVCGEEFTCDQDMNLTPFGPFTDRDVKWVAG